MYCGKENAPLVPGDAQALPNSIIVLVCRDEPRLAHNVVLKMVEGLANVGHIVVMDNFFSSIGLFMDLLSMGIYATWTIRLNQVGLPSKLSDVKSFKNILQGHTIWRMYDSHKVACVMWKDKKPVLLISTHALPIQALCKFPVFTVPRWRGVVRESIFTSTILVEYTRDMQGMDVADQLCASYSCQVRSHKWWYHVFSFFLS